MNLYNAEISAGSLLIPESRRIAELLLSQPSSAAWNDAIVRDNILQKKTGHRQTAGHTDPQKAGNPRR